MALRISLILAILAGLGVIGVSQFMLRPQIEGIREKRDYNEKEWKKTDAELKKTKKNLKETSEKLTKTESNLEETKGQLTAVTAKFEAEQKRAVGLQQSIDKLRTELKSTMDDLAAWTNLGLHVEQVKGVISEAKSLRNENEGLQEESKVLLAKVKKLDAEVKRLTGPGEDDPPLPREVRGKVLVVDPKWNFLRRCGPALLIGLPYEINPASVDRPLFPAADRDAGRRLQDHRVLGERSFPPLERAATMGDRPARLPAKRSALAGS